MSGTAEESTTASAPVAAPADEPPGTVAPEPAAPASGVKTLIRVAVVLAALVIAYFAVRHRLPSFNSIAGTVRSADPGWVTLAVAAEAVSIAMFAAQQRQLLSAFRVRMSPLRALVVTLSRSAIAVALPAGSAVSAGFAFQQYRARGASRPVATTVTILSALASTVGLCLLFLGGLTTVGARWLRGHRVLEAVLAALLVAAVPVVLAIHRRHRDRPTAPAVEVTAEAVEAASGGVGARLRRLLSPVGAAVREARAVPARHWVATIGFAVANWLLDLVCLIAVARACHLDIGYPHLAAAYLAVQIVRQIPLTPGGIGLIETSLLAGLVSAGAGQATAAAVVLGYRLLSCWLIIPIGLTTWLGLRLPVPAVVREATRLGADRPSAAPARDRRTATGPRSLAPYRHATRRLSRLQNNGPGGIRRPRRRQPH